MTTLTSWLLLLFLLSLWLLLLLLFLWPLFLWLLLFLLFLLLLRSETAVWEYVALLSLRARGASRPACPVALLQHHQPPL